jgi:hypothetical protein
VLLSWAEIVSFLTSISICCPVHNKTILMASFESLKAGDEHFPGQDQTTGLSAGVACLSQAGNALGPIVTRALQ